MRSQSDSSLVGRALGEVHELRAFVLKGWLCLLPYTLLTAGCSAPDAGPAILQIDTPGELVDDYVIRPAENFSTLHGGYPHIGDWMVVSSGETIEIALSKDQPDNVTSLSVDAVHPEYRYSWTAAGLPGRGGAFRMPLMAPERWSKYLEEREVVDFTTVIDHLQRVHEVWAPTVGAAAGAEIHRYLPILRRLTESAAWSKKDESFFTNEVDARTKMLTTFGAIQRLAE